MGELIKAGIAKEDIYIMSPTPAYPNIHGNSPCSFQDKVINEDIPKLYPYIINEAGLDLQHNYINAHKMLWGKNGDRIDLYHKAGH